MVLELPPASSPLLCAGAALLLGLHITAGCTSIASGFTALAATKGGTLHRRAGQWFFVSMLLMSGLGAAAAAPMGHPVSVVAGSLSFYLTASGWLTMRRRPGTAGDLELIGLVLGSAVASGGLVVARRMLAQPDGLSDAVPASVFTALAVLGVAGDIRFIRRGGLDGRPRLVRHLWRLCTALLIATVSLFLGQQRVFPAALRGSPLLYLPELAVLASLVFWLVRTRGRAPAPLQSREDPAAAGMNPLR